MTALNIHSSLQKRVTKPGSFPRPPTRRGFRLWPLLLSLLLLKACALGGWYFGTDYIFIEKRFWVYFNLIWATLVCAYKMGLLPSGEPSNVVTRTGRTPALCLEVDTVSEQNEPNITSSSRRISLQICASLQKFATIPTSFPGSQPSFVEQSNVATYNVGRTPASCLEDESSTHATDVIGVQDQPNRISSSRGISLQICASLEKFTTSPTSFPGSQPSFLEPSNVATYNTGRTPAPYLEDEGSTYVIDEFGVQNEPNITSSSRRISFQIWASLQKFKTTTTSFPGSQPNFVDQLNVATCNVGRTPASCLEDESSTHAIEVIGVQDQPNRISSSRGISLQICASLEKFTTSPTSFPGSQPSFLEPSNVATYNTGRTPAPCLEKRSSTHGIEVIGLQNEPNITSSSRRISLQICASLQKFATIPTLFPGSQPSFVDQLNVATYNVGRTPASCLEDESSTHATDVIGVQDQPNRISSSRGISLQICASLQKFTTSPTSFPQSQPIPKKESIGISRTFTGNPSCQSGPAFTFMFQTESFTSTAIFVTSGPSFAPLSETGALGASAKPVTPQFEASSFRFGASSETGASSASAKPVTPQFETSSFRFGASSETGASSASAKPGTPQFETSSFRFGASSETGALRASAKPVTPQFEASSFRFGASTETGASSAFAKPVTPQFETSSFRFGASTETGASGASAKPVTPESGASSETEITPSGLSGFAFGSTSSRNGGLEKRIIHLENLAEHLQKQIESLRGFAGQLIPDDASAAAQVREPASLSKRSAPLFEPLFETDAGSTGSSRFTYGSRSSRNDELDQRIIFLEGLVVQLQKQIESLESFAGQLIPDIDGGCLLQCQDIKQSAAENSDELVLCPVCLEEDPVVGIILIQPCQHILCNTCLEKEFTQGCPLCRGPIESKHVPSRQLHTEQEYQDYKRDRKSAVELEYDGG